MRDRATSEVSTRSSLELSYSDVESIGSHFNMTDINTEKDAPPASLVPTPPTFPTEIVKGDLDKFEAPLVPQVVHVFDQPKSESKPSTKNIDKLPSDSNSHLTQLDMDLNATNVLTQPDKNTVASRTKKKEIHIDIATLERDPVYFCEIALLVAEDRVFCVPKGGLLEHGNYFQSLFSQLHDDVKDGIPFTGSMERRPIVLEGISKIHFHNFLRVIYPFYGVDVPSDDEHWLGILDLATKWGFQEVRELALIYLEHLFTSHDRDPVRALVLCQKYNIDKHIKQQCEAIITSIKPFDSSALLAGGLDTDTVLLLMGMSNRWMSGMLWGAKQSQSDTSNNFPRRTSARKIVEDHFAALTAQPLLQDEVTEAAWIQDEAERLEDSVKRMEEARKNDDTVRQEFPRADPLDENVLVEPRPQAQQRENPWDDECADDIDSNEDIPDDAEGRIEKLILLHHNKYRHIKYLQDLKEKGVDETNLGMRLLTNIVDKHDQKLKGYWEKVAAVPATPPQDDLTWENTISVNLSNQNAESSRQKVEQAIKDLLHPTARSLALSISFGNHNISVPRRKSAANEVLNRFGLLSYTRHFEKSQPRRSKVELSEEAFGNWLEEFKGRNGLPAS